MNMSIEAAAAGMTRDQLAAKFDDSCETGCGATATTHAEGMRVCRGCARVVGGY